MHDTLLMTGNSALFNDVLGRSPFHYFKSLDESFRSKLSKAAEQKNKLYEKFKNSELEEVYRDQWEVLLKRSKI